MKPIQVVVVALIMVLASIFFPGRAEAYKDTTRSQALQQCEDGIAWLRKNTSADEVLHAYCKEVPYDDPFPNSPEFLGCFALWGAWDNPSENNYNTDYEQSDLCYGRIDDPVGANAGAGGGGGDGGCHCSPTHRGDPVNTATGNKYVEEDDYTADSWLRFRRFYNSDAGTASDAIGMRWRHSFSRKLARLDYQNGLSIVSAYRPDGTREIFRKSGTSGWSTTTDSADSLTEVVDDQGVLAGYKLWIAALRHTEIYTPAGLLTTVRDETGQTLTLLYSDSSTPRTIAPRTDLLLAVIAPNGRQLTFTYNGSAYVQRVTLPDGGTLTYDYDTPGNLTAVTYPDGKKRQYLYNESALTGGADLTYAMTGIVDENGVRYDSTSYDATGRAVSTELAGGAGRVSIQYNADGSSDVTSSLGSVSHEGHATVQQHVLLASVDKPCGDCGQQYASRTYDANSRPSSYTDFNGNLTAVTYDVNGLLTQQIEAKSTTDQRTTDTVWDVTLRTPLVRTVKDNTGKVVSKNAWAYNASGLTTAACVIDPVAAPTYVCSAAGTAPAGVRRTVTTYCNAVDASTCPLVGLMLAVDGPRTDVSDKVTYAYYPTTDESGCATVGGICHRLGDLKSTTDGVGLVTTYLSYDRAGRTTRIKAPNGVITDFTYTPRGWLATKIVRAAASGSPSPSDATTTISYNPDGTVHQVKDADAVTTTYGYDAAHRLTDVIDGGNRRFHYTLDAAGNRTKEQSITDAGTVVRTTSQSFNALGQLTAITDGLNRTVFSASAADSYDGNGNLVHSTDGLGIQQKNVFDGLDRLVSTLKDYQGTNAATANTQSVTTFDALDRVTGFSDPDGLNTTYDIDALGNVTGLHSPDTGTTALTYDISGNRKTSTDAVNVTHAATYDANNRLLTDTYADTSLNVQYKYDEADSVTGCTGSFGRGHLTRIVEGNGGMVWCYDNRGNVVKKQQTVGADTRTTTYAWTSGNRLKSVTTPNGTLIAYTRNALGQITSVQATPSGGTAATVASAVVYKSFGPVASYKLGDGQTVTLTYDATGALTDIASAAFSLHVKRDAMGNIVATGNAAGVANPTEAYSYDSLYRLTAVKSPSGSNLEAYTYNETGDRLSKVAPGLLTGAYNYEAGTHHLVGVGATTRHVDARGNTTANAVASGSFGFGYNQRNRLTAVQSGGATVGSYLFNALGQRVQKTADNVITRFDYDEDSRLQGEGAGSNYRDYIWMGDMPVAVVDHANNGISVGFIYSDGLGSPRAVTNTVGVTQWLWPYEGNSFGELQPSSNSGYVLNLRFPGQYFDIESGLNYNISRDYEPGSGRYIESDPIGLSGGSSTYVYASSNPVNRLDPRGQLDMSGPMGQALKRAAIVDTAGGGPEDPIGDVAAIGAFTYTLADAIARAANQKEVHDVCDQPPPPGLSPCDLARWKLNKALQCKQVRQAMADKWFGSTFDGGHAMRMDQLDQEIERQRAAVERQCRPCP